MWRRIIAAAVVAVGVIQLCGCSGSGDERRPTPETKRNAPSNFEGSGFQGGTPSEETDSPPADE